MTGLGALLVKDMIVVAPVERSSSVCLVVVEQCVALTLLGRLFSRKTAKVLTLAR